MHRYAGQATVATSGAGVQRVPYMAPWAVADARLAPLACINSQHEQSQHCLRFSWRESKTVARSMHLSLLIITLHATTNHLLVQYQLTTVAVAVAIAQRLHRPSLPSLVGTLRPTLQTQTRRSPPTPPPLRQTPCSPHSSHHLPPPQRQRQPRARAPPV